MPSSPNSLGPKRDWPEVRGEECRPRTVLSWLLAKWVVGESEEAGRRTLSSHGPENPEEKEIALSLKRWEQKHAPAYVSIRPGAEQLWRTQEGAHGDGQTEDVLDRLGLLLYRRELLGEALDGVAEQPSLGDGGVEKACLVDVLHLCQVEPEMALLDHHGGHRLPKGPRHDFRRS